MKFRWTIFHWATVVAAASVGSAFADHLYAPEVNAIRERSRVYVVEMNHKYSSMKGFEAVWKEIGERAEMFKRLIPAEEQEIAQEGAAQDALNRYFLKLVSANARMESAQVQLEILKSSADSLVADAESYLVSGGFDAASSLSQVHQANKSALATMLAGLESQLRNNRDAVRVELEKVRDYRLSLILEEQKRQGEELVSDLRFWDHVNEFQRVFSRIKTEFRMKLVTRNYQEAEELLMGYAWLRGTLHGQFAARILTAENQRAFDSLSLGTARTLEELKEMLAQRRRAPVSGVRKMLAYSATSDSGGGGSSRSEELDPGPEREIPENMRESGDGKSRSVDVRGDTYKVDGTETEGKWVYEGQQTQDPDRGIFFELGESGDPIRQEDIQSGLKFLKKVNRDLDSEMRRGILHGIPRNNDPRSPENLDKRQFLPEGATIDERPSAGSGPSLPEQTKNIRDMARSAVDRSTSPETKKPAQDLLGEVERFEDLQEFFGKHISNAWPKAASAPKASLDRLADAPSRLPRVPSPENFKLDPEVLKKLRDGLKSQGKTIADVALGVAGGPFYDVPNFIASIATGQDLMGNETDGMDKAMLGAAAVLSIVEPVGSKGPVLRKIGRMLKNSDLSKAGAQGLKELARTDPHALGGLLKDMPAGAAEQLGKSLGKSSADDSAGAINDWLKKNLDYDKPPYDPGSRVLTFEIKEPTEVYRVFGGSTGQKGRWVVPFDPTTQSKSAIRDKFAIPGDNAMDRVSKVRLMPGDKVRVGPAGKLDWGNGGGMQIELLDRLGQDRWKEPKAWTGQ